MNKDKATGKAKELAGRAERKLGKLTGSKEMQVKGSMREIEGKVQNSWGKAKDAASAAAKRTSAKSAPADNAPRAVRVTRTTKTTVTRVKRG